MKDLDEKELKAIDGGNPIVWAVVMWALGEYHDMKQGCADAVAEW